MILDLFGCEAQDLTRDRVTVVSGSVAYSATVPTGSKSSRSLGGNAAKIRRPWLIDGTSTAVTPSTTLYWFHYRYSTNLNSAGNTSLRLGVGRSGVEGVCVSAEASTNRLTLVVAGNVRATATTESFTSDPNVFKRIHVKVDHQSGGNVNVYVDGNVTNAVITYALTATDITNLVGLPNEFNFTAKGSSSEKIDDVFALDPAVGSGGLTDINQTLSSSIQPIPFTGNGTYTAWTGAFGDIDELPNSDVDFIEATAVGQAETFTQAGTTEARVHAVKMYARVTRTGTDAGSNLALRMRDGTTDQDTADLAAPGDGDITYMFHTKVGGGAWTAASLASTQFGVVAKT